MSASHTCVRIGHSLWFHIIQAAWNGKRSVCSTPGISFEIFASHSLNGNLIKQEEARIFEGDKRIICFWKENFPPVNPGLWRELALYARKVCWDVLPSPKLCLWQITENTWYEVSSELPREKFLHEHEIFFPKILFILLWWLWFSAVANEVCVGQGIDLSQGFIGRWCWVKGLITGFCLTSWGLPASKILLVGLRESTMLNFHSDFRKTLLWKAKTTGKGVLLPKGKLRPVFQKKEGGLPCCSHCHE